MQAFKFYLLYFYRTSSIQQIGGFMNLKLWASASAVAVATVFAQDYYGEEPTAESAPTSVETVAAPAPTAPVAEVSSSTPTPAETAAQQSSGDLMSKLDVLRGNSYNFVGNELAATTIGDQLAYPYMRQSDSSCMWNRQAA